MLGRTSILSAFLVGASLVHSFSLSSSCSASLQGLVRSEDAACLNGPALLSAVLGSQDNINIPRILDSWLSSLCSTGSCSDDSLAKVTTNITTGCSSDFAAAGVDIGSIQGNIVDIVKQVYPAARDIACLKDTNANQFCAIQTINNLDNVLGGITMDDLSFLNLLGDVQTLIKSGKELACTNCAKQAFSIARSDFPQLVSEADSAVTQFCGASFADGQTADGVSQTAKSGSFVAKTQNNGASTWSNTFGRAGMVLVALSSAFVFMA